MNFAFDLSTLVPYEITKYKSDLTIVHPTNAVNGREFDQLNR